MKNMMICSIFLLFFGVWLQGSARVVSLDQIPAGTPIIQVSASRANASSSAVSPAPAPAPAPVPEVQQQSESRLLRVAKAADSAVEVVAQVAGSVVDGVAQIASSVLGSLIGDSEQTNPTGKLKVQDEDIDLDDEDRDGFVAGSDTNLDFLFEDNENSSELDLEKEFNENIEDFEISTEGIESGQLSVLELVQLFKEKMAEVLAMVTPIRQTLTQKWASLFYKK